MRRTQVAFGRPHFQGPCSSLTASGRSLIRDSRDGVFVVPKVEELDAELAAGLKQAKGKRMYFAVVVKGGTDGALIVSKQKIPPTAIAEAKKKCGGSALIKSPC